MKSYLPTFCIIIAGLLLAPPKIHAQSYSISWYKISGGGASATSADGKFSLTGTIGQQDAGGAMAGGNYSVTGGFWSSSSVVQTPGAPLLSITFSGSQAIVSWPPSATGWTLQTNSTLGLSPWGNYGGQVFNNSVTNSSKPGNLFFRLSR